VVNQWASWCTSCRYEFPFFQRLAAKYRGRVAFLGVDSQDNRGDAEEFLKEYPTPFPHYFDPDVEIAREFGGGRAWPTTAYYNAAGKLTETHIGAFASEAKLDEGIREYALGG
jgi:cytochrome c biogenesis protein CcmG/thiol:disulfide interchange protein DsbE